FGSDTRTLALRYALWMIATTTIAGCAAQLAADAAIGVLETLFLAAAPLARIVHARALAHALHGVVTSSVLLAGFCAMTRWWPAPALMALAVLGALPCWLAGRLILDRCALACRRAGTTHLY